MSSQSPVDAPSSADEDFEIPETTMVEVVEEVVETIKATRPTKAETRMEGKNKRVFYVNRKVAIMEEVHLKNNQTIISSLIYENFSNIFCCDVFKYFIKLSI